MEDRRPKPEEILARIKEEELKQFKGKLTIFLGAAPGVGKTYTMLKKALERLAEGDDITIGIVESHGRKEIEMMITQIEHLPLRKVHYHNRILKEFDIDNALKRKPKIILIDELAHTNLPNSRHAKRWQDTKEILDHGIDVYTTLNVQHLESLNDVVSQITGIVVRETVPDLILEEADVVELIDLPPDDLLKRLEEGRVYAQEQAELAKENFFNKGNLIALRELALRITAERVGAQVLSYRQSESISKTWPTTERLLVCINADAQSAKLVRAARRMASRLQAEWIAAHVETIKESKLSDAERHNLESNFRLAERLGGETFTLSGRDVVEELIGFARDRNVTKIVIGKELGSRLKTFFFGSFVDELLRRSGDIDVYVIQGGYEKSHRFLPIITIRHSTTWRSYLSSLIIMVICTLIGFLVPKSFDITNIGMIYLLGIIIISMRGEKEPILLSLILGFLALDLLFIPPKFSFYIPDKQHFIIFAIMLTVTLLVSKFTISSKNQAMITRLRERRTLAMYALSRKLAGSRGLDQILHVTVTHIAEVFDSQVAAMLPNEKGDLTVKTNSGHEFVLDDKEKSVAQWVFNLGRVAGLGTQALPVVPALYVPLIGKREISGVLRVLPADQNRFSTSEQLHLLETFANQAALVIEVDRGSNIRQSF